MLWESREDRSFRLGCQVYAYIFCSLVFGIGMGIYFKSFWFLLMGVGFAVLLSVIFILPDRRNRNKKKEWEESRAERAKNSNADDYFRSQK